MILIHDSIPIRRKLVISPTPPTAWSLQMPCSVAHPYCGNTLWLLTHTAPLTGSHHPSVSSGWRRQVRKCWQKCTVDSACLLGKM